MSTEVLRPGQVIAGRYRVESLLGRGGMGSVYRGAQLDVVRPVALKVLVDQHADSKTHVERFKREAQALARLSHPNTVRLFDFGTTEDGHPYLVMEFLDGIDLARRLEREGSLPCEQALHVCLQVLRSLEEAHERHLIHRDIKPANVLLCRVQGNEQFVKVLDFGIAGSLDPDVASSRLTAAGTVIGSAAYMSPEQVLGAQFSAATDLYAVGVVLFEMLTGALPFRATSLGALHAVKASQPALRLADVRRDLNAPAALNHLIDELLLRDPAQRPASARAVAERMEALVEQMSTRPTSPPGTSPPRRESSGPSPIAETEPMTVSHTVRTGPGLRDAVTADRARDRPGTGALRRAVLVAPLAAVLLALAGLLAFANSHDDPPPEHDPERETQLATGGAPSGVLPPHVDPPHVDPPPHVDRPQADPPQADPPPNHSRERPPPPPEKVIEPLLPSQPSALDVLASRYPTVAALRVARDAGEIGQIDSNTLIRALRQRRLEARTRVGDLYKAGRISLAELKQQQLLIEEAFEGAPP